MSTDNHNMKGDITLARWRLVLGRFAENGLGGGALDGQNKYVRMDRVLDYLYGREYSGRGVRETEEGGREGGNEQSQLTVPGWIREVRELFPQDTVQIVQRHALERYNMTELVTDPQVLEKMEPNYDLLKAVLTFKDMMKGEVIHVARRVVKQTIEELRKRLMKEVRPVLWGRLNRKRRTHLKTANNLDWRRTIRANLRNYDAENKRIIIESLHFFSRTKNYMPWHIIMAVDCSGSMLDSVIHSAIMAGIFKGLPSTRVSLIAFDTAIIDLTDQIDDPTELLMSIQLGGGTNIGGALRYCETLVNQPTRTILVLVTDFCEGGSPGVMLSSIKRMKESGVKVLGLAALDMEAAPVFDEQIAQQCVDLGAEVAALTPQRLAEWMEKAIS